MLKEQIEDKTTSLLVQIDNRMRLCDYVTKVYRKFFSHYLATPRA